MGLFGLYLITWQAPKMHLVHDFLKILQVLDDGKIRAQSCKNLFSLIKVSFETLCKSMIRGNMM